MDSHGPEQYVVKKVNFQQPMPLWQIVYQVLKDAVIAGVYPLGERINENSLAELLSISRTPIRTAVNHLINEGLLEHISGYGTIVKNVNENKIREIFKIRTALDLVLYDGVLSHITLGGDCTPLI